MTARPIRCAHIILLAFLAGLASFAQQAERKSINLPTSKILTAPAMGRLGFINSFPGTIATSPDGRFAALLNYGYGTQESRGHQSITILNLENNSVQDFPDERLGPDAHQSYFVGLAFSSDGTHLYASVGSITDPTGKRPGDTGNGIAVYMFDHGKLTPERFIPIAPQQLARGKYIARGLFRLGPGHAIPYPAGLAVVAAKNGDELLVANNYSDNVVLLDTATGNLLKTFDLSTNKLVPSAFPYAVVATRDGKRAWCSLWNESRLIELDLQRGDIKRSIDLPQPKDATSPGPHPTTLLLSSDEKILYAALSNADQIAVVSVNETAPRTVLLRATTPDMKFGGTVPSALAASADGQRLFVAAAGINAVAVFDTRETADRSITGKLLGFIPTDWYPSALAVHGDDLLIATAKGQGTGPNDGLNQISQRRRREHPYIVTLLRGSIARVNWRTAEAKLDELTREVEQENLFLADPGKIEFRGGPNPIKHVIYVLKENRTYDQILGDLKVGDGDRSLTMYGEDITPNEHKLALQFGVLDNFYDSGEVSGDGHIWSTAAITSDYNERTWQIAYRGKERTYDYQGTVADEYAMEHGEPDVDDPGTGFLWGNVAQHGLTYRDYGEFINGEWCAPKQTSSPKQGPPEGRPRKCDHDVVKQGEPLPKNVGQPHGSPSPWTWPVPIVAKMVATKPELREHFDPLYPDFNTEYPDQLRADEFLNEFEGFVRARQEGKGTQLPQFVLLYLPDDHTAGKKPRAPQPAASVADNDLALGRVVEAVSHSPYWADTAILVLEDDAQDGVDHVDAHRSIAFVISKYSPGSTHQPFVAHQFYTTVNMIHTIESLLGLPPMNVNDAWAPVMSPLFTGQGTQPPFTADYRNRDNGLIYRTNPAHGRDAELSSKLDFTHPDAANAQVLNGILWRDRMGDHSMPKPRHSVFPSSTE